MTRDQLLIDMFTTALEGGINYWSACIDYHWQNDDGEEDYAGFRATIIDECDDDREYVIDRAVIIKGFKLAATKEVRDSVYCYALTDSAYAYRYGGDRLDDLDYDSTTADAIVQLGLFGDVIYS